jgi:hypothetical protein
MSKRIANCLLVTTLVATAYFFADCNSAKNASSSPDQKGLKDYYKDYFTMGVAVSPQGLNVLMKVH